MYVSLSLASGLSVFLWREYCRHGQATAHAACGSLLVNTRMTVDEIAKQCAYSICNVHPYFFGCLWHASCPISAGGSHQHFSQSPTIANHGNQIMFKVEIQEVAGDSPRRHSTSRFLSKYWTSFRPVGWRRRVTAIILRHYAYDRYLPRRPSLSRGRKTTLNRVYQRHSRSAETVCRSAAASDTN